MKRVRSTLGALFTLLLLSMFTFVACEDDDAKVITPTGGSGNDNNVESVLFDLVGEGQTYENNFGASDTLDFTVTAKADNGEVVSGASVKVEVHEGLGKILLPNGNKTDDNGMVSGKLIVVHNDMNFIGVENSIVTKVYAESNSKKSEKEVTVVTRPVNVRIITTEEEVIVAEGTDGNVELTARVMTDQGVTVKNVPVRMRIKDTEEGEPGEGSLSEITKDDNGAWKSTLTVNDVTEEITTTIVAVIDVPIIPLDEEPTEGKKGSENGEIRRSVAPRSTSALITEHEVEVKFSSRANQLASIRMTTDFQEVVIGPNQSQDVAISLVATDVLNNGIQNLQIYIRVINEEDGAPVGSLTVPALTDASGRTSSTLATDGYTGRWHIFATTNRTTLQEGTIATLSGAEGVTERVLNVRSGSVQTVTVESDTNRIAVAGTNGLELAHYRVTVKDENGQFVEDGTMVHFLIEQAPRSTDEDAILVRLNETDGTGSPFTHPSEGYGCPYDVAETVNGIARMPIYSGSEKGTIILRTWVYQDTERTDSTFAVFNGVQVVSGPPASVEIDYDPAGESAGASAWAIEVSARVQDARNNDVADGVAVIFSTEEDNAHVTDGETGNMSADDEVTPGVAFAKLIYHSLNTNEQTTLHAKVDVEQGVMLEDTYVIEHLPLQQGRGVLDGSPMGFNYTENETTEAIITCTVTIKDGTGHVINGSAVRFLATMGQFFDTDNPNALSQVNDLGYSGEENNDGKVTRYLRLTKRIVLPEGVPMAIVTIQARVEGNEEVAVEPFNVTVYP